MLKDSFNTWKKYVFFSFYWTATACIFHYRGILQRFFLLYPKNINQISIKVLESLFFNSDCGRNFIAFRLFYIAGGILSLERISKGFKSISIINYSQRYKFCLFFEVISLLPSDWNIATAKRQSSGGNIQVW